MNTCAAEFSSLPKLGGQGRTPSPAAVCIRGIESIHCFHVLWSLESWAWRISLWRCPILGGGVPQGSKAQGPECSPCGVLTRGGGSGGLDMAGKRVHEKHFKGLLIGLEVRRGLQRPRLLRAPPPTAGICPERLCRLTLVRVLLLSGTSPLNVSERQLQSTAGVT